VEPSWAPCWVGVLLSLVEHCHICVCDIYLCVFWQRAVECLIIVILIHIILNVFVSYWFHSSFSSDILRQICLTIASSYSLITLGESILYVVYCWAAGGGDLFIVYVHMCKLVVQWETFIVSWSENSHKSET